MTGDCHVRFCERLRGAIPLDLLGEEERGRKGERLIMYATDKIVHNVFILSLLSFSFFLLS
jgi:hypothetical protein